MENWAREGESARSRALIPLTALLFRTPATQARTPVACQTWFESCIIQIIQVEKSYLSSFLYSLLQ